MIETLFKFNTQLVFGRGNHLGVIPKGLKGKVLGIDKPYITRDQKIYIWLNVIQI